MRLGHLVGVLFLSLVFCPVVFGQLTLIQEDSIPISFYVLKVERQIFQTEVSAQPQFKKRGISDIFASVVNVNDQNSPWWPEHIGFVKANAKQLHLKPLNNSFSGLNKLEEVLDGKISPFKPILVHGKIRGIFVPQGADETQVPILILESIEKVEVK